MRKWKVVLAVLLFTMLAGCQEEETAVELSKEWYGFIAAETAYSSQGVLKYSDGLRFYDAASGTTGLVCSDASCKHDEKSCSARLWDAGKVLAGIDGDKLLFVTNYGADRMCQTYLYEADLDGSNRKQKAYLGNFETGFYYYFLEDYIIFDFWNQYDENMVPLETETAGVYVYDKKTGMGNVVYRIDGANARIPGMVYQDGKLFFFSFYIAGEVDETMSQEEMQSFMEQNICCSIYMFDLAEGSLEVIKEGISEFMGIAAMTGRLFCNLEGRLELYDIEEKEWSVFSEEFFLPIMNCSEDYVVFQKDSEYFVYTEAKGMQPVGTMGQVRLDVSAGEVMYCKDYSAGGELVYMKSEDFMQGKLQRIRYFEK